jgi:hypothetical protein
MFHTGEIPARLAKRMQILGRQFPDSPEIAQLAGQFRGQLWSLRGVVGTGLTGSAVNLSLGGVRIYLPGHERALTLIPGAWGGWDRLSKDTTASLPTIAHDIGSGLRGFTLAVGSW